jgi:hypothetical protein
MIILKYESILFYYIIIINISLVFTTDVDINKKNVEYNAFTDIRYNEVECESEQLSLDPRPSCLPTDVHYMQKNEPISEAKADGNIFSRSSPIYAWIEKISENEDFKNINVTFWKYLNETFYEANINPECLSSLIKIYDGFQNKEIWSLKCNRYNFKIESVIVFFTISFKKDLR